MGIFTKTASLSLFLGASIALLPQSASADLRVGQNDSELVLEAADFDCRLPTREQDFNRATEHFVRLLNDLRQRFPGPWSELGEASQNDVRQQLQTAIRAFYQQQYERNHRAPSPTSTADLPRPTGFQDDLHLPWGQVLKPSAMWISVSRRLLGNETREANVRSAERTLRAARAPISLSNLNGGITMQLGLIAAPLCRTRIPLAQGAEPTNSRGWNGLSWDFEPFVMVYARGGLGTEIVSRSRNWLHVWRPSVGMVWGDLEQAADVAGGFFNGGFDANFELTWSRIPAAWRTWGMNWKGGCISNPSLEGVIPLPLCKNFFFVSWRPQTIDTVPDDGGNPHWSMSLNGRAEAGVMMTGAPAIRLVLTLLNYSPEQIEETLRGVSWLVDAPQTYRPTGTITRTPPPPATPAR